MSDARVVEALETSMGNLGSVKISTVAATATAPKIFTALQFCQRMYETPTSRAYKGISTMLDRLAKYMENTQITDGRDGNISQIRAVAKDFEAIRSSFKGAYKDLQDEQSSRVRGGLGLAYDS